MTRDELMAMAAEKAAAEVSLESIEFLFRPTTLFELLLRSDFNGTLRKFSEAVMDDSPGAVPRRSRSELFEAGWRAIEVERFYRGIRRAMLTRSEYCGR